LSLQFQQWCQENNKTSFYGKTVIKLKLYTGKRCTSHKTVTKAFVCNITVSFQYTATKWAAQFKRVATVTGTPQSKSMGASSPYKCVCVK